MSARLVGGDWKEELRIAGFRLSRGQTPTLPQFPAVGLDAVMQRYDFSLWEEAHREDLKCLSGGT